jgi:NAD-dependent oxidoreductase involved in siderophore biosynthesis
MKGKPSPEYAVSLTFRDGHYVPVVHVWERHVSIDHVHRSGASGARIIAQGKAVALARRLGVPFCETEEDVSKALARYVIRSSAGHVSATNVKRDVLARHGITAVAERYGLRDQTVRSIRDLLSGE